MYLKQKKQDLDKLATQDLPDLMQELNIKNFTLNNGAKVLVDDVLSGSIPSASSILRAKMKTRWRKRCVKNNALIGSEPMVVRI